MAIGSSELIVREDGSIYHLNLHPDDICDTIITVGDPNRVGRISRHFDSFHFQKQSREIVSHSGRIGSKEILVLSTGMGPDNVEIVMNELDALVNIDLAKREIRKEHRSLSIIRIGTSGGIHPEIECGDLVASRSAVGLDPLMDFYAFRPSEESGEMATALQAYLGTRTLPYAATCSEGLFEQFGKGLKEGFTLTCPGFYGPQGRTLRLPSRDPEHLEKLINFNFKGMGLTNIEMETAAMYAFGEMMGHEMLSLNAIVADRRLNTFAEDPHAVVDQLIRHVLERMAL